MTTTQKVTSAIAAVSVIGTVWIASLVADNEVPVFGSFGITPCVIAESSVHSVNSRLEITNCAPNMVKLTARCDDGTTPMLQCSCDLANWRDKYLMTNSFWVLIDVTNGPHFYRLLN